MTMPYFFIFQLSLDGTRSHTITQNGPSCNILDSKTSLFGINKWIYLILYFFFATFILTKLLIIVVHAELYIIIYTSFVKQISQF